MYMYTTRVHSMITLQWSLTYMYTSSSTHTPIPQNFVQTHTLFSQCSQLCLTHCLSFFLFLGDRLSLHLSSQFPLFFFLFQTVLTFLLQSQLTTKQNTLFEQESRLIQAQEMWDTKTTIKWNRNLYNTADIVNRIVQIRTVVYKNTCVKYVCYI